MLQPPCSAIMAPAMIHSFLRRILLAFALFSCAVPAFAQDDNFTPFVITLDDVVDRMLRMADVGPADFLIDLGSGDGRIPIAAARRFGARGLGVDLDPPLVALSRENAKRAGVADRVSFEVKDIFETDLTKASVVAFYLLPEIALQLRPKLLRELKPGARIVAHDYALGDWQADEWTSIRVPDKPVAPVGISTVFLWVVPADARGHWSGDMDGHALTIDIEQKFQMLKVRFTAEGTPLDVRAARLRGEEINLVVAGRIGTSEGLHRFHGRLHENRIEGEVLTGTRSPERAQWKVKRK